MNDETIWHKCRTPLFPRWTVDGHLTFPAGQTWRRRRPDGRWEYQHDIDRDLEREMHLW